MPNNNSMSIKLNQVDVNGTDRTVLFESIGQGTQIIMTSTTYPYDGQAAMVVATAVDNGNYWTFTGTTELWAQPVNGSFPNNQGVTVEISVVAKPGSSGVTIAGTSGSSGIKGAPGTSGSSGISGTSGTSGSSGSSGIGAKGASGTSGSSGISGTSGTSGSSGSSGTDGPQGPSGAPGNNGTSGTNGTSGSSGSSGSSGTSGAKGATGANAGITNYTNASNNRILTSVDTTTINSEANLTFDGSDFSWKSGNVLFNSGNSFYGQDVVSIKPAVLVPDGNMADPMMVVWDNAGENALGFQASSLRFKSDVETLNFDVEAFLSLDAREFTWTESGKRDIGFIAEEVAEFDTKLGVRDGQGGYISMHYDKMTVYLFQVVKELHNKVKELENRINSL